MGKRQVNLDYKGSINGASAKKKQQQNIREQQSLHRDLVSILIVKKETSDCSAIWSQLDLLLLIGVQRESSDWLTDVKVE